MTVLEQAFASGGSDVIIPTLELSCSAWSAPILICAGFEDHTCIDETGRSLTFIAAGIDVSLPKRNTQGTQILSFAIDNVTGQAQKLIDNALEAGAMVYLTFRYYLLSNKSAPAENPLKFVVREGTMEGTILKVNAAFFDMINTAWPRKYYTADFAPGLKYIK